MTEPTAPSPTAAAAESPARESAETSEEKRFEAGNADPAPPPAPTPPGVGGEGGASADPAGSGPAAAAGFRLSLPPVEKARKRKRKKPTFDRPEEEGRSRSGPLDPDGIFAAVSSEGGGGESDSAMRSAIEGRGAAASSAGDGNDGRDGAAAATGAAPIDDNPAVVGDRPFSTGKETHRCQLSSDALERGRDPQLIRAAGRHQRNHVGDSQQAGQGDAVQALSAQSLQQTQQQSLESSVTQLLQPLPQSEEADIHMNIDHSTNYASGGHLSGHNEETADDNNNLGPMPANNYHPASTPANVDTGNHLIEAEPPMPSIHDKGAVSSNKSEADQSPPTTTAVGQAPSSCETLQSQPRTSSSEPAPSAPPPSNPQQQQQHQQHPTPQKQHPHHQPPGWRVKLYRLNSDGTWDDCGTGRIQFYFAKASNSNSNAPSHGHHAVRVHAGGKKEAAAESSSSHATAPANPPAGAPALQQAVFRELGEPMLCMRAEMTAPRSGNGNSNNSGAPSSSSGQRGEAIEGGGGAVTNSNTNAANKVLLRTRVLLHDAYQCQGGNIITWCEPFHAGGQQQQQQAQQQQGQPKKETSGATQLPQRQGQHASGRASPRGVDLALSFQDNAGCNDIWQHILDVQLRAKELSHFWTRSHGGGGAPATTNAAATASKTSSLDASAPTQLNSIGQTHGCSFAEVPIQHHHHQPLSPEKSHHVGHAHQPLSPNSPDHDALEDRQLSMVTLPKHPPLWSAHHGHLHHSNASQHQQRLHHLGLQQQQQQQQHGEKEEERSNQPNDGRGVTPAASYESGRRDSSTTSSDINTGSQEGDANAIGRAPSPLSLYGEMNTCGSTGIGFESTLSPSQLPDPPKWSDIDEIVDAIAGGQMQQREDLLIFLSQSDCAYIKSLLGLFRSAPEDRLDRGELAALALCIKSILLLNDPEIIEYVTTDEETFEAMCGVLEYNPELREKANYREFIREKAKFRTVFKMDDDELVSYIHRLFRVNYLKDFILRPTMDESSLSTLVSLAQFTQSDIIKGVIRVMPRENDPEDLAENYYTKVLRVLGTEIKAIRKIGWEGKAAMGETANDSELILHGSNPLESHEPSASSAQSNATTIWAQHVAPQDSSLQSRHVRRKGCLSFLKELFNMARSSLQQNEKDEFILSCVNFSVQLTCGLHDAPLSGSSGLENPIVADPPNDVNLLFLIGAILSDPGADINERSAALEILSVITMHDPAIVRRHCLNSSKVRSGEKPPILRPEPDELRQLIFLCPPDDLLQSLLLLMSTESDAGLLLQTSEIIRIILDTEMMNEQGSLDGNGFMNDENDLGSAGNGITGQNWNSSQGSGSGGLERSEQDTFLSMFYERYVAWLFSPFLYKILVPKVGFLLNSSLKTMVQIQQSFRQRSSAFNIALRFIPSCAIRSSFTLEILSFCVRAHVYRMKLYVLRTRLLSTTLKILSQKPSILSPSDDRCLKLASLKLLRSVLSVKDEFYHRHIVQYNLFAPVFELFRAIPVGNNLVSSTILEMCDFIRTENIKSLIEYIVTKHLSAQQTPDEAKSLEEIASPYVDTFKQLRKKHEENAPPIGSTRLEVDGSFPHDASLGDHHDTSNGVRPTLNKKALEDQRKFRETDEEESYFNDDSMDTEEVIPQTTPPPTGIMPLMENVTSLQG